MDNATLNKMIDSYFNGDAAIKEAEVTGLGEEYITLFASSRALNVPVGQIKKRQ